MTRTRRNDPCPCGSGRKYKRCCLALDSAEAGHVDLLAQVAGSSPWIVEAVPLAISIEERGSPRPVALLVVAGGVPIHQMLLGRLSGEPEAVADALERVIAEAAAKLRVSPQVVVARHPEVVAALSSRLQAMGASVAYETDLPELEELALELMDAMGAPPTTWPPIGTSKTWAGWGLPRSLVDETFRAAATFYESAPWRHMENLQAPRATLPGGGEWTACVLGGGDDAFGLALHSDADDLYEIMASSVNDDAFEGLHGRMVALTFEPLTHVHAEARREMTLSRWRLAGPAAYPELMTVNTPGGGVSEADLRDLLVLLDAVPRFAEAHAEALEDEKFTGVPCDPIEWTDEKTGMAFRYEGEGIEAAGLLSDAGLPGADARREVRRLLEEVAGELGEDAGMDEVVAAVNQRLAARMGEYDVAPQTELGSLAPAQVHALLQADWSDPAGTVRLRRDLPESELLSAFRLLNTRELMELVAADGSLGRTAAGNLRVATVRELMARLRSDTGDRLPAWEPVTARIIEEDVWPLHEARVVAELAGLLGHTKTRFRLTDLGAELLDTERAGALYALLFQTSFRELNLAYGEYVEWPELQHQVAFTLRVLPDVAGRWRWAENLVDEAVLPYALEQAPAETAFSHPAMLLERQVLRRLVGFGLIDMRGDPHQGSAQYRTTPLYSRFLSFAF